MAVIIPLCSSSGGNSVFAGARSAGVLIDVGCSFKRLRQSLDLCGLSLDAVKAVLITHEHIDHIKGLYQFTKHTDIPVFASRGTLGYLFEKNLIYSGKNLYELAELDKIPLDFKITAFNTPHDASESVGYILEKPECKIAYCTDLGIITEEVRENVTGADFVFMESNYQPELLRKNINYPAYIKKRVASDIGHLSNNDCADFLAELIKKGATRFILGHLSRENNTPALAFEAASSRLTAQGAVLGRDYTLEIAPVVTEGKVVAV